MLLHLFYRRGRGARFAFVTLSLGRSTVPLELMATLNLMDLHFLFRFPYLYP